MSKHFVQEKIWAKVRETQGQKALWLEDKLLLIRKLPRPFKSVGLLTMTQVRDLNWGELQRVAREQNLSYVHIDPADTADKWQLEPSVAQKYHLKNAEELFLRHTVLISLDKPEEQLLEEMDYNTRYNCRYALKNGVTIEVRDDTQAIEEFIKLYFHTVKAAGFHGRTPEYYRQLWKILAPEGKAKIVLGMYKERVVVARFLFLGQDTIFTAYTGWLHDREVMKVKASNGVMWEVMRWAKSAGFKYINMWGIQPNVDKNHPEYGYTQFKLGFGGELIEYAPSMHMVIDQWQYYVFQLANRLRWLLLKVKSLFR